ncbi:J domain-containing protein [Ramlibacter sp. G-1-2-2]|uniref:J domain-containing protein n=1 Tax=Ramlibacter agri TaxID=2728837 RepID=A0A848HF92_9BURK|nr:J domain-containing protein [Ramlibacter agri]NML48140.1 J domain-containing protein [Ramlibacter agri]
MATESMPTYYDVLQVERDASPDLVRAAYRKLAHKYHPDKMPGNANAVRAMAAINAAYEVLSDSHRRAEHDLWIRRMERPAAPARSVAPTSLWAFVHPAQHWARYLLCGTLLFVVVTLSTALYLTSRPARAAMAPACQLAAPAPAAGCPGR